MGESMPDRHDINCTDAEFRKMFCDFARRFHPAAFAQLSATDPLFPGRSLAAGADAATSCDTKCPV
ncbi:hypothetical protein XC93_25185 [Klebsiella variicola]|nr:hypothetical protein [Klebsiella variicola]MDT7028312.1 hypothetical protein [Klebsiella variicola]